MREVNSNNRPLKRAVAIGTAPDESQLKVGGNVKIAMGPRDHANPLVINQEARSLLAADS